MRLLAILRMLLAILDENRHAAALVSTSFPAELRSMISSTERHLDALGDQGLDVD